MRKKGLTLVEILMGVMILGVLAAIVLPIFMRPDITVHIYEVNGKKELVYQVDDRYDYKELYFQDVGFDGNLNSVKDSDGVISDPNTITIKSAPSERTVSWKTWVDRFEQEIRPEAVGN